MRTLVYTLSRMGATYCCVLNTYGILVGTHDMPLWTQLPPWSVLAVNWRWICVMLSKQVQRRRRPASPTREEKKSQ